jgi:hypothetical protein
MTKEDLESKFEDCFDANTRSSEGGYGPDVTDRLGMWRAFDSIVAEFAKQQAIAFDIWKLKNHWLWDSSICKYFKWEADNTHATRLNHEELHSQFIEQQIENK